MNCANLVSNGPIFADAGRIFPFPARDRRARAPDAAGALPADARQAVDIPAVAANSAPGAPPRLRSATPKAGGARQPRPAVKKRTGVGLSPTSDSDHGAALSRPRSGKEPAGDLFRPAAAKVLHTLPARQQPLPPPQRHWLEAHPASASTKARQPPAPGPAPQGTKKGRIPLQEFSLVRLGCDDYLISMRRDAGAFSSTFFLGMSMVITPCSTLAEIFSVSTLSGSNRLCWKRLYENSRRR